MSEESTGDAPKIHIDSDWKAEAQAEKERLAEQAKESPDQPSASSAAAGGPREMPPANFETLISTIATQALMSMGGLMNRATGQPFPPDLDLARHQIDMLGVIEEKTKGNLSDEESKLLATTTYELRQRYIALAGAARGV